MKLSSFFRRWGMRRGAAADLRLVRGRGRSFDAPPLDESDWEFVAEIWSPKELSRRRLPSVRKITASLQAFREPSERSSAA